MPVPAHLCTLLAYATVVVASGLGVTSPFARPAASKPLTPDEVHAHLSGRRLARAEEDPVEQVHLAPGVPGEMVVTFVTRARGFPSAVVFGEPGLWSDRAEGKVRTYSSLICPDSSNLHEPTLGAVPVQDSMLAELVNTSAFSPSGSAQYKKVEDVKDAWDALSGGCIDYNNPRAYWQSFYIHTVALKGIRPGATYSYRPVAGHREFQFTALPAAGTMLDADRPLRIGMMADVGVTNVSASVMHELLDLAPDFLVIAGDYSYADGWAPRWDTFGQLMEPLMAKVPLLGVPGNHEIAAGRQQGRDWEMRYPVPYNSDSPFWYSYAIGPMHMVGLVGSYAATGPGSPQYEFLKEDLEAVDRTRTPWVVVVFHTPWYSSNEHHFLEGHQAQQDLEGLLYEHGVDLVVNGHVHSYERSHPVFNNTPDACGATHLVIGDGGNYEGPAQPWREPQPSWSAFREASFGAGMLTIINGTHATWEWRRTACVSEDTINWEHFDWKGGPAANGDCATSGDNSAQAYQGVDRVGLVRDVEACPRKGSGPRRLAATKPGFMI
jgi:3',5'-cyclic AMP phosphodiesterase CpdA